MCHFWANPLSLLVLGNMSALPKLLQQEHLESLRSLSSFRRRVDVLVDKGDTEGALALLEDDKALLNDVLLQLAGIHDNDIRITEIVKLLISSQLISKDFTGLYQDAIDKGINLAADESSFVLPLKRLPPEDFVVLVERLLALLNEQQAPETSNDWHERAQKLATNLTSVIETAQKLIEEAALNGGLLRSAYSRKSRVVRATVVAQKVQLSQDTAELTAEDKAYTELIDGFVEVLCEVTACEPLSNAAYHEIWLFDAKMPYRDVVTPKLGSTFERALLQSQDYLGCKCCVRADDGVIASNMPAAAILYQLYLEAGSYINVADLWSSFAAMVGSLDEDGEPDRQTLLRFYRGLAELKGMGFVKQSRKKADHVAKVKWL
jgi:origin recognition complex subunit 3